MKGFLQEYGVIMVVVAVVLGMLAFGKTGYAKSIQDAILGSTDHIVETGENITKGSEVKSGDILDIEGNKYIALERNESDQLLVMTVNNIKRDVFRGYTPSIPNQNTYEGSDIDNYLENEWYKGLSAKMQSAIQTTSIKQVSYKVHNDPNSKQETGPNSQVYNTISRHVFLPSLSEIGDIVDLNNKSQFGKFMHYDGGYIWTRDSYQKESDEVIALWYWDYMQAGLSYTHTSYVVNRTAYMRPTFVIDLSQVDYKVAGHVDYK